MKSPIISIAALIKTRSLLCHSVFADMASLLFKSSLLSRFHSLHPQTADLSKTPLRKFHIEPGAREKALLEEDPALKKFKSYKRSAWRLKRVGDALTIVVVAGCCYEIYVRSVIKKKAVEAARSGEKA